MRWRTLTSTRVTTVDIAKMTGATNNIIGMVIAHRYVTHQIRKIIMDDQEYEQLLQKAYAYLRSEYGNVLTSLLYDIDLLPAQVHNNPRDESRMLALCMFFEDHGIGRYVTLRGDKALEGIFDTKPKQP